MKKILMYRWKAYNYLDIRSQFEAMGYEVDEIWQHLESYDVALEFAEKLHDRISAGGYEFVFTVNYFAVVSNVCKDLGVIYVAWSCDSPLISMYHESVFNDNNRIFIFDYASYHEFKDMGVENVYYLPLCVNTNRLGKIIEEAKDLYIYENEISFVGSLYERNSYDRIESQLSDYLRGYLEGYMQIQSQVFGESFIDVALTPEILAMIEEGFDLEKSEGSFSDLGLVFATTTLGFKTAALSRINGLNELSRLHDVSIYTGSDASCLFRVKNKGALDYWKDLPKAFFASRINLNFTIPNIKSGIPLRCWDIMGSKGFMITSYQTEIPLFFNEGEDIVTFKSIPELIEKAGYYLDHDKERDRIVQSVYEKVNKYHTYEIRIKEMMEMLDEAGL